MLCFFRGFGTGYLFIKLFFIRCFAYVYSVFMLFWILFVTVFFTLLMAIFFSLSRLRGFGIFGIFARNLLYLWSDFALLFYSIDCNGMENVEGGKSYIIFSNHQGNLDIPILTKLFRFSCSWFVRDDLFRVPIFGWVLKSLSYIPVDRGSVNFSFTAFRGGLRSLLGGNSLVIFPEGTWSPYPHRLLPFKGGIYRLGLHTGLPLLPVTIVGSYGANPPDSLRFFPSKIRLEVHSPVYVADYVSGGEEFFLRSMEEKVGSVLREAESVAQKGL